MVSPKHGGNRVCWSRACHILVARKQKDNTCLVVLFHRLLDSGWVTLEMPATIMQRCDLPFSNTLAIKIHHHISLFENLCFLIIFFGIHF